MVARVRRTPARAGTAGQDNRHVRVQIAYREVSELIDYENNPRDNAAAVESVANSIRTFGFIIPVVVNADNVIAAGHTRVAAAKLLGMSEVPTISATHLSEKELAAFRIIDNKVAELAKWDFDLLAGELSNLQDSGLVMTNFGFSREELDCLTDVVRDDCLSSEGLVDAAARDRIRRAERRAPATARFVLGELVFFIPATEYRAWVDGVRVLHDYNEQEIVADLKQRLGIVSS